MRTAGARQRIVQLCLAGLAGLTGLDSQALALSIRPLDFGGGVVASGNLVTDDASGVIVDWSVVVRTTERLAHFSKSNTAALVVDQTSASADGRYLTVATSPDPGTVDGGQLFFRSPNPLADFGAMLADFSGANAAGGQAMFMAGAAFDYLSLGAPAGVDHTVAQRSDPSAAVYALTPLQFSGGVTLSGTIRTDGTVGALTAANILGWDLFVDQVTEDLFDKTNSVMQTALVALDPASGQLTTENPGGLLSFGKGSIGGRPHALTLADFTDDAWPRGKAGYYLGRIGIVERPLGAGATWSITGNEPVAVPEPATLALALLGCGALWARRPRGAAGGRAGAGHAAVRRSTGPT